MALRKYYTVLTVFVNAQGEIQMKKMFLSVVCLAAIAMLGGCSGASSVQNLESSAADSTIVTVENSNSTVGMSDNTSLASNNTVTTTKTTVAVSNGTTEAIKTNATTTKEATTTTATVKKTELTVNSFVESMSKSVTITATGEKAASMIGAVEGKSITVGGKTFESSHQKGDPIPPRHGPNRPNIKSHRILNVFTAISDGLNTHG